MVFKSVNEFIRFLDRYGNTLCFIIMTISLKWVSREHFRRSFYKYITQIPFRMHKYLEVCVLNSGLNELVSQFLIPDGVCHSKQGKHKSKQRSHVTNGQLLQNQFPPVYNYFGVNKGGGFYHLVIFLVFKRLSARCRNREKVRY